MCMNPVTDIFRAFFALAFVVGLMWLMGFLLKKYGNRFGFTTPLNTGRNRRLQLIEILPLDNRNKLAIVRRDSTEHLILLGVDHAEIIENNIPAAQQITENA